MEGLLPPVKSASLLQSYFLLQPPAPRCLDYSLCDSLWFYWASLDLEEASDSVATRKKLLLDTAKILLAKEFVTSRALMETAEGDFLEALGLIPSYAAFRRREIQVNTRAVYTQQKYNLLREESEGYAKLVTLLNQSFTFDAFKEAKALIGFFDLDPNRTCSLVLDALAAQPDSKALVRVLGYGYFTRETIVQLLGFRFFSSAPVSMGNDAAGAAAAEAERPEGGEQQQGTAKDAGGGGGTLHGAFLSLCTLH